MELHHIPLEHLTVAKTNARTHGATENLDSLAAKVSTFAYRSVGN